MSRKEFEVLDNNGNRRGPIDRYTIIKGNLDGKSDMYEFVGKIEDNCGYLSVFRDKETTASISVQASPTEHTLMTLVGDESKFDETFKRIKLSVPRIFTFKHKNGKK